MWRNSCQRTLDGGYVRRRVRGRSRARRCPSGSARPGPWIVRGARATSWPAIRRRRRRRAANASFDNRLVSMPAMRSRSADTSAARGPPWARVSRCRTVHPELVLLGIGQEREDSRSQALGGGGVGLGCLAHALDEEPPGALDVGDVQAALGAEVVVEHRLGDPRGCAIASIDASWNPCVANASPAAWSISVSRSRTGHPARRLGFGGRGHDACNPELTLWVTLLTSNEESLRNDRTADMSHDFVDADVGEEPGGRAALAGIGDARDAPGAVRTRRGGVRDGPRPRGSATRWA